MNIPKELQFTITKETQGYSAVALGHAIITQGETIEELFFNIREAIACHFEDEEEKIESLHFSQKINQIPVIASFSVPEFSN